MKKQDLNPNEFDIYYNRYIDKLKNETELIESFLEDKLNTVSFFNSIPSEKLMHRYQPNKWSIKEILQHLIDTERIFMYRCFRIAREDKTPLAGYDQDVYVSPSNADNKTLQDLLNEFNINRDNSIALLKSLSDNNLSFIGNSNGGKMSARAAAFVIPGHNIWHKEVINKKYL